MNYYEKDGEWRDHHPHRHHDHVDHHHQFPHNEFPPHFNDFGAIHNRMENAHDYTHEVLHRPHHGFEDIHCLDAAIHNIEKSVYYNGAFYNDIHTDTLYDSAANTIYTLTKVPRKRKKNKEPIIFKLHPAQGDKSNSKITEDGFTAAKHLLADKCFTAFNGSAANGWDGYVIIDGAEVSSPSGLFGYTVGFDRKGHLHSYIDANSSFDTLKRDNIANSMGIEGILISSGEKTNTYYGTKATSKCSRVCLGENPQNHTIYILGVSDYDVVNLNATGDNRGLTAEQAADILLELGCVTAVCVTADDGNFGAAIFDKGEVVLKPSNAVIPNNYAYWYISNKHKFCNEFTFDVANLTILYGELKWYWDLELEGLEVLINRLLALEIWQDDVVNNILPAIYARLDALEAWRVQVEAWQQQIEAQIAVIDGRLADAENEINILKAWRLTVDTWISVTDVALNSIRTRLTNIETDVAGIHVTLAAQDQLIQNLITTVNAIETDINNLKQQFIDILTQIQSILDGTIVKVFEDRSAAHSWLTTNYPDNSSPSKVLSFYYNDSSGYTVSESWNRQVVSGAFEWIYSDTHQYPGGSGGGGTQLPTIISTGIELNANNDLCAVVDDTVDLTGVNEFILYFTGDASLTQEFSGLIWIVHSSDMTTLLHAIYRPTIYATGHAKQSFLSTGVPYLVSFIGGDYRIGSEVIDYSNLEVMPKWISGMSPWVPSLGSFMIGFKPKIAMNQPNDGKDFLTVEIMVTSTGLNDVIYTEVFVTSSSGETVISQGSNAIITSIEDTANYPSVTDKIYSSGNKIQISNLTTENTLSSTAKVSHVIFIGTRNYYIMYELTLARYKNPYLVYCGCNSFCLA